MTSEQARQRPLSRNAAQPMTSTATWGIWSVLATRPAGGKWDMATRNGSATWITKQVFTTGEAAEICNVSQQTIIRCFDSGRLQGFRVPGSRFRRIPRTDLLRFMRTNDIPTDSLERITRRVLVVDDDPKIVELFQDIFDHDDRFSLRTASTGYEAGMITKEFRPNIILLDYMLPDINGNVVCKSIREDDELRDTKILIVSGVINQSEIDELIGTGADGFVKKPFNIEELTSRMIEMTDA